MQDQKTIIWDWNGTLLDDVDICIRSMNHMLNARQLPVLDLNKYRQVFTFPVREYYEKIGFDFSLEPWDKAAIEFIELYLQSLPVCNLASGAAKILALFRAQGYHQAIISAMQHDALVKSVEDLGIASDLDYIGGIGDHYGAGKIDNARQFVSRFNLQSSKTTLIGDTLHDAEVAGELGCMCILVANGHQSKERLIQSGQPVVDCLDDLYGLFDFSV